MMQKCLAECIRMFYGDRSLGARASHDNNYCHSIAFCVWVSGRSTFDCDAVYAWLSTKCVRTESEHPEQGKAVRWKMNFKISFFKKKLAKNLENIAAYKCTSVHLSQASEKWEFNA